MQYNQICFSFYLSHPLKQVLSHFLPGCIELMPISWLFLSRANIIWPWKFSEWMLLWEGLESLFTIMINGLWYNTPCISCITSISCFVNLFLDYFSLSTCFSLTAISLLLPRQLFLHNFIFRYLISFPLFSPSRRVEVTWMTRGSQRHPWLQSSHENVLSSHKKKIFTHTFWFWFREIHRKYLKPGTKTQTHQNTSFDDEESTEMARFFRTAPLYGREK